MGGNDVMQTVPLKVSLWDLCRRRMAADQAFLAGRNVTQIPDAPDWDLFEAFRLRRLRETIAYVKENSRFYRRHFADVDPRDLASFDDLSHVPMTTPADIAAAPFDFLCTSQSEAQRAVSFETSGTSGPHKRVFFGAHEIDDALDFMAAGMATVADADDVVQVMLPKGPSFGQCDMLSRAVTRMGAKAIPAGTELGPLEQFALAVEQGSTVLFGETLLIYRMTKALVGRVDMRKSRVHTLFLTTSLATSGMVAFLEEAWGARVRTHYGMTEACFGLAVSCPCCGGRHYNELDAFVEIVNATTGAALPAGETGELVLTTLNRHVMPLVRYCTHDLSSWQPARPTCPSAPMRALGQVGARSDVAVRLTCGFTLVPTAFHELLFSFDEVVDYRIEVTRGLDGDELTFLVELADSTSFDKGQLQASIEDALLAWGVSMVRVAEVRLVALGALADAGRVKPKIIVRESV